MTDPTTAPYGSWRSPISADLMVSSSIRLGQLVLDGPDCYWLEGRPAEKGRNVVVCQHNDGSIEDLTPPDFNVRTRVHEYGGGAYLVYQGWIYFSNFKDQRLYCQAPGQAPYPLTPTSDAQLKYANGIMDQTRQRLILVREDARQSEQDPTHALVSLPCHATDLKETEGTVLLSGHDFYASPCLSPDGTQLAWLCWDHPNMPWDATELWVATVNADGSLRSPTKVAGDAEESIFQPQWSPDGVLYFVSDRSNWWNLYRYHQGVIEPVYLKEAEFGLPQWAFGLSTYGFIDAEQILCTYTSHGTDQLAILNTVDQTLALIETPYTSMGGIKANSDQAILMAGSALDPAAVVHLNLDTQQLSVVRQSSTVTLEREYLSLPVSIEFPTESGLTAHGFYYPPQNRDFVGPTSEKPPLLVKSHGGPTGATAAAYNLRIQYWTSRGFAVLDVNYGGSTGYGRQYRQRLNHQWGLVDVNDCINGALYLVKQGAVDGQRLAIDGGSAGGYTTLAALTFRNVFKAGASYYGVSDLEALVRDTHKFESRYLDRLIGPYPAQKQLYYDRSPIHFVDQLSCPVIFFQGLEDKIVPPNQAELMVQALREKGIPVAYVAFEGEQHGFRQADSIKRALESEFYFFSQIFGFEIADAIEPVTIENT